MKRAIVAAAGLALTSCFGHYGRGYVDPLSTLGDLEALSAADKERAEKTKECAKLVKAEVAFQEEQVVGDAAAIYWLQDTTLVVDSAGKAEAARPTATPRNDAVLHLNVIGRNLALQSTRPTLPWTFGVFDDAKAVNAVALPGGKIFLTRGLLKLVENEAQLAAVLAHEIAHVTRKHGIFAYQQVKKEQCESAATGQFTRKLLDTALLDNLRSSFSRSLSSATVGFLDLDDIANIEALATLVDGFGQALKDKGYSHKAEFAADLEGLELVIRAGYNPREYLKVLKRLPATGIFSHHPSNEERISRLEKHLEKLKQPSDAFAEVPSDFESYPVVELSPVLAAVR